MRELPEVQEAKDLMNKAMEWSAFKWLFEKSKVRETADGANDALDRLNLAVKSRWSADVKASYKRLVAATGNSSRSRKAQQDPAPIEPHIKNLLEKVIEADEAARRARDEAENVFDEAERQMSTSLAGEGCKKAIHSWELHEKAIRRAQAVAEVAWRKE